MTSLKSKIKKYKLTMSFILIIVLFLSIGIIIIKGVLTLGTLTKTIYQHPLVVSNASLSAAINITKIDANINDVVLAQLLAPQEIDFALKAVSENEHNVYQQLDIIREVILGKEGQILEKQTRQLFADWKPIREEIFLLLKSGNTKDAILIAKEKGAAHVIKLETKMLELTSYARKKADDLLERTEVSQSKLEHLTHILILAGVFLSIIIACIATSLVTKAEKVLQEEKNKLQKALDEIKTLQGILPICSHCKQIRDDKGSWKEMEGYIQAHSEARFSHSVCPDCAKEHYPEHYESNNPGEKQED
jgi:hypothetical protein